MTISFWSALKIALVHLSIFSGFSVLIKDNGREIYATIKPNLRNPRAGSVLAHGTPWGDCHGKFKLDYEEGRTEIKFYPRGKKKNSGACKNGDMTILTDIAVSEIDAFLKGTPALSQIEYRIRPGEVVVGTLQINPKMRTNKKRR